MALSRDFSEAISIRRRTNSAGARYFSGNAGRNYDVSPDGERFLFVDPVVIETGEDAPPPPINIVLNWFEELKERVPVP